MQIITDRAHNGLMTAMLELELLLLLVMVVLVVLVVVSVLWCRWLALWIRHARTPPSSGLRLSVVCAACCRCLVLRCLFCHSAPPGCGFAVVIKIFSVLFRFCLCIWHISLLLHCISFHFFSSSNFFQRLFNFHFHFGRHELCQLCRLCRTFVN